MSLSVSLAPDHYNSRTNLSFALELSNADGLGPPPLTGFELRLPAGLHYQPIEPPPSVCEPHTLESSGPQSSGCTPSSRVGTGTMFLEVPFGDGGRELPTIEVFAAPPDQGRVQLLAYVRGEQPVYTQVFLAGELTTASSPSEAQLSFAVPLIPSVPGGPDASPDRLSMTLDTARLTYSRRIRGRWVHVPRSGGFTISRRCPRGGFPFSATATFDGGASVQARASVPCPKRQRQHERARKRRRRRR